MISRLAYNPIWIPIETGCIRGFKKSQDIEDYKLVKSTKEDRILFCFSFLYIKIYFIHIMLTLLLAQSLEVVGEVPFMGDTCKEALARGCSREGPSTIKLSSRQ